MFISATGAKRRLTALHENGVLFRDDFESSEAFNSALWYGGRPSSSIFLLFVLLIL